MTKIDAYTELIKQADARALAAISRADGLLAQNAILRKALESGCKQVRMQFPGRHEEGMTCVYCDALAATPEASLTSLRSAFLASPEVDAIRKATLEEAWERAEGACYGQAARASFEHITPWLKPAYFGPYASEVKW